VKLEINNAVEMMVNLSQAFPEAQQFIFIVFYVIGIALVAMGLGRIIKDKRQGNSNVTSFAMIVSGSLLLALPGTMGAITQSFFGNTDPRQILSAVSAGPDPTIVIINTVIAILTLLGWIAGGKGIVLLSQAGNSYRHSGAVGRGITHIIGGAIMTNIVFFAHVLGTQLGIDPLVSSILRFN